MDLGVGLFTCQQRPDDDRPLDALYDEMLTLGRSADESDLDSIWVSEHHFLEDNYLSGVLPALGALAAVTDDVELGSSVALAPLYNPVRLAEDAATVDQIANGRLTLGVAIGSNVREYDDFGIPRDERVDRMTDTIEILKGAWSDGLLGYESSFHDISPAVDVTPRPADEIPIVIGGTAKPAVRRAARRGDGWVASSSLSIDGIRMRLEDIECVRERKGIPGEFDVYVIQYGFIDDSRDEAWEAMRDGYFYSQRRYQEIKSGETVEQLTPEDRRELKQSAIFGTPDQVAAQLNEYQEILGKDIHFIFRVAHPGIGTDSKVKCIERLGDEVYPQVR